MQVVGREDVPRERAHKEKLFGGTRGERQPEKIRSAARAARRDAKKNNRFFFCISPPLTYVLLVNRVIELHHFLRRGVLRSGGCWHFSYLFHDLFGGRDVSPLDTRSCLGSNNVEEEGYNCIACSFSRLHASMQ